MKIADTTGSDQSANFLKIRISHHLRRVGAENLRELSFEQRKKIFLLAIKDFMDESIGVDELDYVSLMLNDTKTDPTTFTPEEYELFTATLAGSELSFYVRKFPVLFSDFMSQVKEYYDKYYPF